MGNPNDFDLSYRILDISFVSTTGSQMYFVCGYFDQMILHRYWLLNIVDLITDCPIVTQIPFET